MPTLVAKPPAKPPIQRPYALSLSVYANNLLNRNNRGNPLGNMSSPYFLKSTSSSGQFLFAAGEGSGKLAAYRIDAQTGALTRLTTHDVGPRLWWVLAVAVPAP